MTDGTPGAIGALLERIAHLEATVTALVDRRDAGEPCRRYMRAFDRNDADLLRTAFWPDAQINYAQQINTVDDFLTRHLDAHTAQLLAWGHLLTNETVDLDGDTAHVETYVSLLYIPREGSEFGAVPGIIAGRYVDRVERRDGEWRIAVREFIPHFASDPDRAGSTLDAFDIEHVWDRTDLSYVRPLPRRPD